MRNKLQFLKEMLQLVKTARPETLKMSMKDTHHAGLFSLVIGGTEFGSLTRVFIADEDIKPFEVQLHSHRYPISLHSIKGKFIIMKHINSLKKGLAQFAFQSLNITVL